MAVVSFNLHEFYIIRLCSGTTLPFFPSLLPLLHPLSLPPLILFLSFSHSPSFFPLLPLSLSLLSLTLFLSLSPSHLLTPSTLIPDTYSPSLAKALSEIPIYQVVWRGTEAKERAAPDLKTILSKCISLSMFLFSFYFFCVLRHSSARKWNG